jgi:hypothetical protein
LEERVVRAAETALVARHYVSALDIFVGTGLLAPAMYETGKTAASPTWSKPSSAISTRFRARCMFFAKRERGLRPSETAYLARTRGPRRELRFSKSGEPGIERAYRTHFPR